VYQSESNPQTSWTLKPWKASLCNTALKTTTQTFLPTCWLQSCVCETAADTGEHHTSCMAPFPSPHHTLGKLSSAASGRLKPLPSKTEKHKSDNCNLTPTSAVEVELWTHPGEQGRGKELISHCWTVKGGQGTKMSASNSQWQPIKHQKLRTGTGLTNQLSRWASGILQWLGEA
jgi:hypothetical protein